MNLDSGSPASLPPPGGDTEATNLGSLKDLLLQLNLQTVQAGGEAASALNSALHLGFSLVDTISGGSSFSGINLHTLSNFIEEVQSAIQAVTTVVDPGNPVLAISEGLLDVARKVYTEADEKVSADNAEAISAPKTNPWLAGNAYVEFVELFSLVCRSLMAVNAAETLIARISMNITYSLAKDSADAIMKAAKEQQMISLATAICAGVGIAVSLATLGLSGRKSLSAIRGGKTAMKNVGKPPLPPLAGARPVQPQPPPLVEKYGLGPEPMTKSTKPGGSPEKARLDEKQKQEWTQQKVEHEKALEKFKSQEKQYEEAFGKDAVGSVTLSTSGTSSASGVELSTTAGGSKSQLKASTPTDKQKAYNQRMQNDYEKDLATYENKMGAIDKTMQRKLDSAHRISQLGTLASPISQFGSGLADYAHQIPKAFYEGLQKIYEASSRIASSQTDQALQGVTSAQELIAQLIQSLDKMREGLNQALAALLSVR